MNELIETKLYNRNLLDSIHENLDLTCKILSDAREMVRHKGISKPSDK